VIAGAAAVPLPSLAGAASPIPFALLSPLLLAVAVARSLARTTEIEASSARPVDHFDGLAVLGLAVLAMMIGAASDLLGLTSFGVTAGRNTVGYLALLLIGRRINGKQAASLLPVAYVLIATLFGYAANRTAAWWAFPIASPGSIPAWLVAGALSVVGTVAIIRRHTEGDSTPIT